MSRPWALLRTADAGERVNQASEVVNQALIDAELSAKIDAALHERTETRSNQRNGGGPPRLLACLNPMPVDERLEFMERGRARGHRVGGLGGRVRRHR